MQVPCGGGHRSWDFNVSPICVTFIYIKDKTIYTYEYPFHCIFHPSLPGRCVGHSKSVCRARFIDWKGEPLILSGSEDTNLRLAKILDRSLYSLTVITKKHVSSIRYGAYLFQFIFYI